MSEEVKCPKCGSTQITAQKKGFSGGKAAAGAILTGGVGLLAGFHGSQDIDCICMACGTKWNPVKLAEEKKQQEVQSVVDSYENWKDSFYIAYEKKEIDEADRLYQLKYKYNDEVTDVHKAYIHLRKIDSSNANAKMIVWLIFIIVMCIIIYWILG